MLVGYTLRVQLTEVKCWVCGVAFAVDHEVYEQKRIANNTLTCPNGCRLGFGEPLETRLRKEMEEKVAAVKRKNEYLEAQLSTERNTKENYKRRLIATKGVVTRTKNRVAKGVCPCCNRYFANLHKHMQNQHPEFASEPNEPAAGGGE